MEIAEEECLYAVENCRQNHHSPQGATKSINIKKLFLKKVKGIKQPEVSTLYPAVVEFAIGLNIVDRVAYKELCFGFVMLCFNQNLKPKPETYF